MPVGKRKREEVAARRAVVLCLRNESNNLAGPTAIAEELGFGVAVELAETLPGRGPLP